MIDIFIMVDYKLKFKIDKNKEPKLIDIEFKLKEVKKFWKNGKNKK